MLASNQRPSAWDIAGALAAGCHAAFVRRPGMALIPFGDQRDVIGEGLVEVAEEITESAGR
jgi:2-haloacid dehalogenase